MRGPVDFLTTFKYNSIGKSQDRQHAFGGISKKNTRPESAASHAHTPSPDGLVRPIPVPNAPTGAAIPSQEGGIRGAGRLPRSGP